jgi:hypothetical protein
MNICQSVQVLTLRRVTACRHPAQAKACPAEALRQHLLLLEEKGVNACGTLLQAKALQHQPTSS